MAQLHLARAVGGLPGAHKLVVIKQMLPLLAEDASFVKMFVDEARLALTLEHPNVVHVFDVGSADGRYFFAMEYLHGEDVAHIAAAARAQSRAVPLAEALAIVIGVAAGLHYAHEKRGADGTPLEIVHRDVSPQNVIVTFDGAVKLLDFGIAKAAHRLTETRHGTIKGKVRYMAPEQIRSEELDRRADVFALGVMLWELTTGCPLYDGPNEFATQRQIVEEDARRPSEVVPGYPPELERIVMKAVARRREERFDTTQALQLALEEFAREHKLAVSPVGLARFLRELFAPRAEALRQAQASGDNAVTELVLAEIASRAHAGSDERGGGGSSGEGPRATRRMPLVPHRATPAAPSPHAPSPHAPAAPSPHAPSPHAPAAPSPHAPAAPSPHAPSPHAPAAPSPHAPAASSPHAPSPHAPPPRAPSPHALSAGPLTGPQSPTRTRRVAVLASLGTAVVVAAAVTLGEQAWFAPRQAAAPLATAAAGAKPSPTATRPAPTAPAAAPAMPAAAPPTLAPHASLRPAPHASPRPAPRTPTRSAPRASTRSDPHHKRTRTRDAARPIRWDSESALPPP